MSILIPVASDNLIPLSSSPQSLSASVPVSSLKTTAEAGEGGSLLGVGGSAVTGGGEMIGSVTHISAADGQRDRNASSFVSIIPPVVGTTFYRGVACR